MQLPSTVTELIQCARRGDREAADAYFGGMTEPEVARALGITERTVRRGWEKGRLLLREALA